MFILFVYNIITSLLYVKLLLAFCKTREVKYTNVHLANEDFTSSAVLLQFLIENYFIIARLSPASEDSW